MLITETALLSVTRCLNNRSLKLPIEAQYAAANQKSELALTNYCLDEKRQVLMSVVAPKGIAGHKLAG
jgi:hypothetical protein